MPEPVDLTQVHPGIPSDYGGHIASEVNLLGLR
jgi:hypothetical protein